MAPERVIPPYQRGQRPLGLGGCLVGIWPGWLTRQSPEAFGFFPRLLRGIFLGVAHAGGGTSGHENAVPSRDPEGAVEAISRAHPSLTVGAQISVIFIGGLMKAKISFFLLFCLVIVSRAKVPPQKPAEIYDLEKPNPVWTKPIRPM